MDYIISNIKCDFVYIDAILIQSDDEESNLNDIDEVLKFLIILILKFPLLNVYLTFLNVTFGVHCI